MGVPAWLPNFFTVIRILLIPVVILFASASQSAGADFSASKALTLTVLIMLGATDLIDGWIARRFALVSQLGALLDAFADKLVQLGLVTYFTFYADTAFSELPVWFLGVILCRDLVLGLGWITLHRLCGRVRILHKIHGKLASFLTFTLLFFVILNLPASVIVPCCAAITALILISTVDYVIAGLRQLPRTG